MKRILYINHSGKIAGAEGCLIRMLEDIDRSRFEPIVVCPEGDLAEASRVRKVTTVVMTFLDYQRNHSVLWQKPLVNPFLVLFHCVWLVFVGVRLAMLVRRLDVQLIHANTLLARVPAWLAGRLARVPVIWHVRDILSHTVWLGIYDKLTYWGITKIITVSNACHDQFSQGSKITTVHDGIATDRFTLHETSRRDERSKCGWTDEEIVFGIFGRITPWKGHVLFVEAAATVHRDYPQTRFLVVGQAWSEEEQAFEASLRDAVSQQGLDGYCLFTGFRVDIPELMSACDVIVVPSIRPDPFPNTVLEGMSCSRAVIAFPVGGIPEAIVDSISGMLVNETTSTALTRAMEALILDRDLGDRLGRAASERVRETFYASRTQRKIEHLYEEILYKSRQVL